MTRFLMVVLLFVAATTYARADNPLKKLTGNSDNLPRLPDDQIEGTVWEYYGTLKPTKKSEPKSKDKEKAKTDEDEPGMDEGPLPRAEVDHDEEIPLLEGQFRTEDKAIFDISTRFRLPDKKKVEEAIKAVKKGKLKDLKLPAPPQQKRIGEYRQIQGSKLRLDFNDKEGLNGLMVIWRKKNTEDVWIGTFTEKQGTKTIRQWSVELRPIED
jgi:hypothetical protein